MPHPTQISATRATLTLLLASDQAEAIKQITITMRSLFPGSRIETVYTAEEALEWATKQDWTLILLDEQLPRRSGLEILPQIRERAPRSAIILQLEQHDAALAIEAMQKGAD